MTTPLDTGPIVAAARADDKDHQRCEEFFAHPPPRPLLLPSTVLIEVCWLINARIGPPSLGVFLERISVDINANKLSLTDLARGDVARMGELARIYEDAHLDPTDLSVIALAERLQITQVATLDRRDFSIVRPRHGTALKLLP